MLFLTRQQRSPGAQTIGIRLEGDRRSYQVAAVMGDSVAESERLARLFIQAPLADQLVREALQILDTGELLDVRDWLRTARAYVETIDGKE